MSGMDKEWENSLFSCFAGGCGLCLMSTFCGCIQYGRNVRILGDGEFCSSCIIAACCRPCLCICAGPKRTSMRMKYGLKEVCINDCITTCCCSCCSFIQIAAEIERRGVPQGQNSGPIGQQMA